MSDPLTVVVTIPGLQLKSPGNRLEHWRARSRRANSQKDVVRFHLLALGRGVRDRLAAAPRLAVRFVRVGGRKMDSDNLVAALKHCRDALADWLQIDDGSDWYDWRWPTQEPGSGYAVRIELETGGGA